MAILFKEIANDLEKTIKFFKSFKFIAEMVCLVLTKKNNLLIFDNDLAFSVGGDRCPLNIINSLSPGLYFVVNFTHFHTHFVVNFMH